MQKLPNLYNLSASFTRSSRDSTLHWRVRNAPLCNEHMEFFPRIGQMILSNAIPKRRAVRWKEIYCGICFWTRVRRRPFCSTEEAAVKREKHMRTKQEKWIVALYVLVILASLAWAGYEFYADGTLKTSSIVRLVAIVAGAVLGIFKTVTGRRKKIVVNKDEVYHKLYAKQIGNAFSTLPKEKKQFYHALDLYNNNENSASVKILEQLDEQCRCAAEQKAIAFFLGVNYDEMEDYETAKTFYEKSLRISEDARSANNLSTCYHQLGDFEKEFEFLNKAIHLEPNDAICVSNMGQFMIRMAEYEEALPYLHKAHQLDGKLRPALSGMAICYAMLGERENYEKAYRMAVTLGYDGKRLKDYIRSLEPTMEI